MTARILIDTSIYRQNPARTGPDYEVLKTLGAAGLVKLFVPYVVYEELRSQYEELLRNESNATIGKLSSLRKKIIDDSLRASLQTLEDEAKRILEPLADNAKSHIDAWNAAAKAEILPLEDKKAGSIWQKYFTGNPPFRKIKSREDLPDAMIMADIEDLVSAGHLTVVVADSQLMQSISNLENVDVHQSLQSLLASESFKSLKAILENPIGDLNTFLVALRLWEESDGEIQSAVEGRAAEQLYGETIRSNLIPDDNHEATIYSYGEPENIEIKLDRVNYSGGTTFTVPFSYECYVSITYYLYKSDFYGMSEDFSAASVSDHNDHYFEIEKEVKVGVIGDLWIETPKRSAEGYDFSSVSIGISPSVEIELLSSPT